MDKNNENKKPNKIRNRFSTIFSIVVIVVSVVLLAVEGVVYYQRSYLTPFWVNGQSMYPTLNGPEYARDTKGEPLDESDGSAHPGYTVEYGVMDKHEKAINKIKRFDIVVTKYTPTDTSNKIKRVLGLPGETIEFKNEYDLYVNDVYVKQPLDPEYMGGTKYPKGPIVLNDNQYYVCGDNRRHSSDSRTTGEPIEKEYITGKAIAICATAEVYEAIDADGSTHLDIKNIKYHKPRYL